MCIEDEAAVVKRALCTLHLTMLASGRWPTACFDALRQQIAPLVISMIVLWVPTVLLKH